MCRRNFSKEEFKKCFACELQLSRREEKKSRRILYPFPNSYQLRLHKRLCLLVCALISQMGCPWSEQHWDLSLLPLLSSMKHCTLSKSLPRNCVVTVDGIGNLGSPAAVGYWLSCGRFLQRKVLARVSSVPSGLCQSDVQASGLSAVHLWTSVIARIQWNPFSLELQLPGISFKHGWNKTLLLSHALHRSGVSEAVFLSFGAGILLCRLWDQAGEGTSFADLIP